LSKKVIDEKPENPRKIVEDKIEESTELKQPFLGENVKFNFL